MSYMSAQAIANKLHEIGFETIVDNGVPYIIGVPYDTAKRAFESMGWNRSWGVKKGNFMVENHMNEEVTGDVGNGNI